MTAKILALFVCALAFSACSTANKSGHEWKFLLGANTINLWRTFRGVGFPQAGWSLQDGVLHLQPGGKGGELISVEAFDNFELEWEWKLAPKANNGLKYLVTESRPSAPGHEYQMVDDRTMANPKYQTAAFYDVLSVQKATNAKPCGEWNQSRLVIQGNRVEHWLNGDKVLSYELGSAETKAALAQSKFKDSPGFGAKIKGHILLTNHNDEAWYRHIRIRSLPPG
jgi:hypothetical protein